jgi:hypothetical protein
MLMAENIPSVLRWAQYLSFFNYAFEALLVNEMRELQLRDKDILDLKVAQICKRKLGSFIHVDSWNGHFDAVWL